MRYAIPTSKFRSAEGGMRYTRLLFWEQQQLLPNESRVIEPMYSLYYDREGLPNFRRLYVELGDPTGYELATRYLEDYNHWQLLMKSSWFREAKDAWDAELDAKLKAEGMAAIRLFANGSEDIAPAVQLQAAKYLADGQHRKAAKQAAPRGRPSKEEVAGNLKQESANAVDIADDLARIRSVK